MSIFLTHEIYLEIDNDLFHGWNVLPVLHTSGLQQLARGNEWPLYECGCVVGWVVSGWVRVSRESACPTHRDRECMSHSQRQRECASHSQRQRVRVSLTERERESACPLTETESACPTHRDRDRPSPHRDICQKKTHTPWFRSVWSTWHTRCCVWVSVRVRVINLAHSLLCVWVWEWLTWHVWERKTHTPWFRSATYQGKSDT